MVEKTDRHSAGQPELAPGELPAAIRVGLAELHGAFPNSNVRCVHWNEHYVGIVMEVAVDIPTRGPVDGIDIGDVEPVVLLLHRRQFPRVAPLVYSDRRDFPAARLPHLNPTGKPDLARLCLHRGSIDDWFAEHSLTDLVDRVRSWLRDAAANRLIREKDRFEGTRIESLFGMVVYRPADLFEELERRWSEEGDRAGYCYLMMTLLRNMASKQYLSGKLSYRMDFPLADAPTEKLIEVFRRYNKLGEAEPLEDRLLIGVCAWTARAPRVEYFGALPGTYGELTAFCSGIGIELATAVREYRLSGAQLLQGTPVVIALLRPNLLIGSESAIELLHFVVLGDEKHLDEDGRWADNAPVYPLSHRTPLTVAFARDLSLEVSGEASTFALVGCGSVGSKVSLHMARAGQVDQILVDPAEFAPHNLVRHALGPDDVGENKATSLASTIKSMYRLDEQRVNVRAIAGSIYDLFEDAAGVADASCILDASASSAVLSAFIDGENLPGRAHYARCEIADGGRLGLLWWEGAARNPRLDDLQAALFNLGRHDSAITGWLQRHREARHRTRSAQLEEIGIGLSCSSATLRLADDVVSYHAALISMAYKQRTRWLKDGVGRIKLSILDRGRDAVASKTLLVPPVLVLASANGSPWQVRVPTTVRDRLVRWMRQAGRNETGGLLLGYAHRKRGAIYVTDALPPSEDSKGSPFAFQRGVKDYPASLDRVEACTGGLIGYVGEWHTHPAGSARLSEIDMAAVKQIRANLDPVGLPTHIIVCAPEGLAAFVFGGGSAVVSHSDSSGQHA